MVSINALPFIDRVDIATIDILLKPEGHRLEGSPDRGQDATYGVKLHEPREEREKRFTNTIRDIVVRAGQCLIPMFALSRAQELLLILDEFWSLHPELHEIPIYYASSMGKKSMSAYQTYLKAMNEKISKQTGINNLFVFKHISNLKIMDESEDTPCVVIASPGMMQSGLSRVLFKSWCGNKKSGVIIAGYCVEGTLAKVSPIPQPIHQSECTTPQVSSMIVPIMRSLLNNSPTEITTISGQRAR
jgi:Cft2 family RNA processing exonuclease